MNSLTAANYLPPLDNPHERAAVGHELAAVLHDLVALSLTGKQLHWMATGPLSHSLHLQLDELVESWRSMADTVAERVRSRLRRVGEVDVVSQDVLIGVTRELEKQQWQLRVQS